MPTVPVKLLHEDARIPKFGQAGDACADLSSVEDVTIDSNKIALIPTGVALGLPDGWEAQIRPRSGLAAKSGIGILNSPGTIDSGYRGEIKIIMINLGYNQVFINKGDRIAQIAIREVPMVKFMVAEKLSETERGEGGFGSTGMASVT